MDRFVGKRIDGRYEIQEIIGVGGMAVVYKARDNQEDRIVAVKILKEEFTSNEEFLRRFKNESKAIAMLSHPNIVNVYDVSFGDLIQYIVMEYIEGITLKEYIEQEGSLRWKDAVHFTLQILKGLQHAHDKGIVHRDVKPQNIMVLSDGTIKVTDFGIARFARSDQRTITDKAIGSVHYISPEQARGEKTDEKADVYSVGVMLYEMLTGKLPFQADSAVSVALMQLQRDPQLPTEINGSIPQGLEQITMHAMQKTPERRYQSSAEMLCDLVQFRKDPSKTFDYSYFVDNAPTKFVGNVNEPEIQDEVIEEEEVREKNNIIPILAGIAVTLIVAIVILAVIFVPRLFSSTGEELVCPKFVGQNIQEIKANTEYLTNFDFEESWKENADFAYGIVYEQSETEGKKLKKDAKITLYISMGPITKRVPDVSGKLESAAVSELKSAGFETVVTEMPSEDVEEGLVIKTEPQRTEVVAEGAKITIFVSSGKPTKNVEVSDVVGMTKEAAEKQLTEKNLVPQIEEIEITMDDKFYPVGYVVKQEPEDTTTKVPEGSTVKLYVCKGYKFNISLEDLPTDFVSESYYLSLWESGKMFNKGDKINSKEITDYTFGELTTTETTLNLTVKISSDGIEEHSLLDITVDNKAGRVKIVKSYNDYPRKEEEIVSSETSSTEDTTNENIPTNTTPSSQVSSTDETVSENTSSEVTSSDNTSSANTSSKTESSEVSSVESDATSSVVSE